LMRFVHDNSILIAWAFDEDSNYADAVGGGFAGNRAVVPSPWPLELSNTLLVAERRRRLTEAEATRIRNHVLGLPIEVMPDQRGRIMTEVLALARQHGLTVYDASNLDLAIREGVPLATLDADLVAAAEGAGVPLFAP
jgi:predicted nucleic acid-binding protein